MKKIFFTVSVLFSLFIGITRAQDDEIKTIFGNAEFKVGGFAGPFMSFTTIDGEFAHLMGGGGCVLINNFFVGGYGLGLTNDISYVGSADSNVGFGHGGFWLGYIFMGNKIIHPVIDVKTGWGSIKEKYDFDFDDESVHGDNIFVLIPSIEIEMNVARFFRIAVGGNYQATFFVDKANYSEKDFSSPGVFLSFKFGAF